MNLKLSFKIVFLLLPFFVFCQNSNLVQKQIEESLDDKVFKSANVSISFVDLSNNQVIGSHRPDKVLVPASSLKLFTSFCSLIHLGENFQFETALEYDGTIESDGTLTGNIYIKGGGDPTFGTDRFDQYPSFEDVVQNMVDAIKDKGIKCIDGNIIADESIFDSYPVAPSWQWNDLGNYYASGAWGLNINENLYYVHFDNRNRIGVQPNIHSIHPFIPKLKLSNEIVIDSAHTGDNAYIFGGPYNYYKRIVGSIPKGKGLFTIKGSIPDPPTFLANHLKEQLRKKEIPSQGSKTIYKSKDANRKSIIKFQSPNLESIVTKTNVESLNLHSECFLKMLGLVIRGQGSGQNGIAVINNQLNKYGIDYNQLRIHDGSGLSARNLISSSSMAYFLSGITRDLKLEFILSTLPRGGYSGTARSMFNNSKAKGNVWLKSGSMSGIQSYSGYIKTATGQWLSFCIIVNGYSVSGSTVRARLAALISQVYHSY